MKAKDILRIHTVPSGDFTSDKDKPILSAWTRIGTIRGADILEMCGNDNNMLCKVPTIDLLNEYTQGRIICKVSPNGTLIPVDRIPTSQEIFDRALGSIRKEK